MAIDAPESDDDDREDEASNVSKNLSSRASSVASSVAGSNHTTPTKKKGFGDSSASVKRVRRDG